MTEVINRNEFDKSYLLIEKNASEENYIFKMLTQNSIPGIPDCKIRFLDESVYLAYDVTDKKTLEKAYTDKKMGFSDLMELFYGINKIMHCANDYLLDREGFWLQPGYMYMDLETEELSCLYYPSENLEERTERYRQLADFLLDKIDHKDEHAVNIAYHFYKISKEEYFSFDSFIGFMEKEYLLVQAKNQKKEQTQKGEVRIAEERNIAIEEVSAEYQEKTGNEKTQWWINMAGLGLGLVLIAGYFFIPFLHKHVVYVLVPGVTITILALLLLVQKIIGLHVANRLSTYNEPQEPVRIEEYFDDVADDVTVFFDQDEYLQLKWKEGHFSKEYILEEFPVTVGKMKHSVQMVIEDTSISRLHARFRKQGNAVYLQDLDSTNGTYVNEKPLFAGEETVIKRGDEIQFGKIIVNVV